MILRKPYAFFIKLFKPIHFVFAICIGFLIGYENKILTFLNNYLYSTDLVDTKNIKAIYVNNALFIIPIVLIILSLIVFGIMYKKNKPYKFYFISILVYLVILIINIYASNFFGVFENVVVAVKTVKLIHDLILMGIISETFLFLVYVTRGFGINLSKFNFSSDIAKFDISDADKEEFELDIKVDLNETKRRRRERLRNLKYLYLENKFLINIVFLLLFISLSTIICLNIIKKTNYNRENKIYSLKNFNIVVDDTYILDTDYEGNRITNNCLVIVKFRIKSNISSKSLFLKDFHLKADNSTIESTYKYNKYLLDVGEVYNEQILSKEFESYIMIFEISRKHLSSDMYLKYNDQGYNFDIKLEPKSFAYGKETIKKKLNENINFKKSLGDLSFKINEFEISDFYKLNYNYCSNKECNDSIEYLRPNIDQNFDKAILKLDLDYVNNSELILSSFYDLLDNFGDIYYKKSGKWYIQRYDFEKIISKKTKNDYVYIGVNKEIKDAENIKFVFKIRGLKYEYLLK